MATRALVRQRCDACDDAPVARCGRCAASLCKTHAPRAFRRCSGCEADWADDAPTRRALQHMFAPAAFVLAGGMSFALLLPVLLALPFGIGATLVALVAVTAGFAGAGGACRLVESGARAQFLREQARGLPVARLLPATRIRARPALPPPRP